MKLSGAAELQVFRNEQCDLLVFILINIALTLDRIIHTLSLSYAAQKDGKEKEEFECPEALGNGNYADPVTCRRFYQVKCASTLHLNP